MQSWKTFCSLPLAEKKKLSGGDRLHDFCYMLRDDTGPHADHKELFHVSRKEFTELWKKAEETEDAWALAFINAIDLLLVESGTLIRVFARQVERQYGLVGFEEEVMVSQNNWTFRYLHYFPGETLSNAHADRGALTLHLDEDDTGGEYLGFDGVWRPWPVTGAQTVIFPGMVLQHRSQGKLKALWHRVFSTPRSLIRGRYALVAFVDFKHIYRFNDALKRVQEYEHGFNYSMPFEEFRSLFMLRK